MIRLIQRRLIIPRGDTGTFTVPALSPGQSDSVGIFTIFDPITKTRVFQKQVEVQDGVFNIEFDHGDTVNLQAGDYLWDIKFYVNPIIENGKVIDGTEIDSYYAAFQTPKCEIRETGDDFMVIDGQPAKIEDLNIILAATSAANAAKVAATEQAEIAATKASEAAERLAQMIAAIPTKVSELENDSGYLQEETDPTVPAWAKAQTKPSYTPQEVGALPSDTFIPSRVSDLTDDSGHYIKPANGIPASDLEETYLTQHQDISMKANSADLAAVATSGDYSDLANTPYIPTKTSDLVNDSSYPVDASYVHTDNNYTTAEKEKLAGIAAGAEVNVNADWNAISGDAQILNKPTNVSAFTNDVGYLTEHQDISGKADKSEIPTQVSELENDAGYLTSFTETDPTVPAWAKEPNKPAYTAAEVNAVNKTGDTMTGTLTLPYINQSYRNALRFATNADAHEMGINARYDENYDYGYFTVSSELKSGFTKDAIIRGVKNPRYSNDAANKEYVDNKISTAIGQVNSFDMAVVQELPTQDISTHTIYLVPKTGETNDVYDEYVYINGAWEMVGNTQIDLSNYVQKTDYATDSVGGVVKVNSAYGIGYDATNNNALAIIQASTSQIKAGAGSYRTVTPSIQHTSTFYGLAKAAGDTTQSQSDNAVGTYTDEAKAAIQQMLDVPSNNEILFERGQGNGSIQTKGIITTSTGTYIQRALGVGSLAEGAITIAGGQYTHAEGFGTIALGNSAHVEGNGYLGDSFNLTGIGDTTTYSVNHYIQYLNIGDYIVIDNEYRQIVSVDIQNNTITLNETFNVDLNNQECHVYFGYANGSFSHAEGRGTVTKTDCQHVQGKFNILDNQNLYADIVGNGVLLGARSNAYALTWTGDGHYAGDVYIHSNTDSSGGIKVLCEADFATDSDIQTIINGGAGA